VTALILQFVDTSPTWFPQTRFPAHKRVVSETSWIPGGEAERRHAASNSNQKRRMIQGETM